MTDDAKEAYIIRSCNDCLAAVPPRDGYAFMILQESFFIPVVKRMMGKTFPITIDKRLKVPCIWRLTSPVKKTR